MSDEEQQVQGAELARLISRLAELELDRVKHSSPSRSSLGDRMEKLLETVTGRHSVGKPPDAGAETKVALPSPEELDGILTNAIDQLLPMYEPATAPARTPVTHAEPRSADLLDLAELVRRDLEHQAQPAGNAEPARASVAGPEGPLVRDPDLPTYNFHLADLRLGGRAQDTWIATFSRLSDDQRALGWVAFHHGSLAAADHAYDPEFVASLRGYYEATEKLCDKMGTLHAVRFNVDAREGVMSFVPAQNDMWLMVFASGHTDIEHLFELIPGVAPTSEYAR